jgi:hypothetical protein
MTTKKDLEKARKNVYDLEDEAIARWMDRAKISMMDIIECEFDDDSKMEYALAYIEAYGECPFCGEVTDGLDPTKGCKMCDFNQ